MPQPSALTLVGTLLLAPADGAGDTPANFLAVFRLSYWNGTAAPTPEAALALRTTTHRHNRAPAIAELRLYPNAIEER